MMEEMTTEDGLGIHYAAADNGRARPTEVWRIE
jgi:hypothetical protein